MDSIAFLLFVFSDAVLYLILIDYTVTYMIFDIDIYRYLIFLEYTV